MRGGDGCAALRSAARECGTRHAARARAEMTLVSIDDCEKLVTLLLARLAKNDCNVKYKVLMVIKVRGAETGATPPAARRRVHAPSRSTWRGRDGRSSSASCRGMWTR